MKITHTVSGLVVGLALIIPLFASAQTIDINAQSILTQINALQMQLKTLIQTQQASTTPPNPQWNGTSTPPRMDGDRDHGGMGDCHEFARDLREGLQGDDVTELQGVLMQNGFLSATTSTGFFGKLTSRALARFQQAQLGLASSTGKLGPFTRNFFRKNCGANGGGMMGSSTLPRMMDDNHKVMGSTTMPCMNVDNQRGMKDIMKNILGMPAMPPCGDDHRGGGESGDNRGGPRPPELPRTVGVGEHCGGNMMKPALCATGLRCAPMASSTVPFGDVGGVCVAN
jgi:hypothetical protein